MCLFLGSAARAEAAMAAFAALEEASVEGASSGLSRDLIHSFLKVSVFRIRRRDRKAYQLINIPTPALATLGRVDKSLICSEMPIQMPGFLFPAVFRGKEAPAAGRALIRSCFVKVGE